MNIMTSIEETVFPAIFKMTNPDRLPDQQAYRQCMDWDYGPEGLLLHGPTRTGKSRTAWELTRRELNAGRTVAVMDSLTALRLAFEFEHSETFAAVQCLRMLDADILLLDDPFKVSLAESVESAVFTLIDQYTQNAKPLIVTLNDTGSSLGARMSHNRSEPIISRLREFCRAIQFGS
jgi:DNA replication protein DnaC